MANTQWLDRSQPQTLYYANVLLYFNAFWWLLYLLLGTPFFGILAIAAIFAGLGVANEKKAGYWGAVAVAVINLLMLLDWFVAAHGQSLGVIINLVFGAALLALLLHPMSRSYQRIWFKKLSRR
ncbi:MAG: hypothetical protein ACRDZX_02580 [Acidimicrobiales bacterium]